MNVKKRNILLIRSYFKCYNIFGFQYPWFAIRARLSNLSLYLSELCP